MQKIGKWCETLLPSIPAETTFSVEFVRILSISDGEQPGFSCVASEITGIKLLLYNMFSNWLELLSKRLKLKSPRRTTFLSGSWLNIFSNSSRASFSHPPGGLYKTPMVWGLSMLVIETSAQTCNAILSFVLFHQSCNQPTNQPSNQSV